MLIQKCCCCFFYFHAGIILGSISACGARDRFLSSCSPFPTWSSLVGGAGRGSRIDPLLEGSRGLSLSLGTHGGIEVDLIISVADEALASSPLLFFR